MKTIIVEVFVPAAESKFDICVPAAMNTLQAAHLTADAITTLSAGMYRSSHNSFFAWRDSGRMLDTGKSMEEENAKNGSKLLLI